MSLRSVGGFVGKRDRYEVPKFRASLNWRNDARSCQPLGRDDRLGAWCEVMRRDLEALKEDIGSRKE